MSEKRIILGSEFEAKIPFHEIPLNSIYMSSSSPRSLCLKASEETAVVLQTDNGKKNMEVTYRPCGADIIIGDLIGVIVESE